MQGRVVQREILKGAEEKDTWRCVLATGHGQRTFQRVLEEHLLQLEGFLEVDLSLAILIYHYPGDSYLHCMCKKVHYAITIKDLFSLFSKRGCIPFHF